MEETGACFGTAEEWAETSMDTRWRWICNYNSLVQNESLVEWNLVSNTLLCLRGRRFSSRSCRTFSGVACFLSPPQSSNVDEKAILHCWTAAMLVLVSAAVFCGIVITGLIKNRMKVNKDSWNEFKIQWDHNGSQMESKVCATPQRDSPVI